MLGKILETLAPTPLAERFPRTFKNEAAVARFQAVIRSNWARNRPRTVTTINAEEAAARIQRRFRDRLRRRRRMATKPAYPRLGGNTRGLAYHTKFREEYKENSIDGDFWCGGYQTGDLTFQRIPEPIDTLAFRPSEFRSKQRQDPELKKGLPDHLLLELPENGKMKTPVMTWVNELRLHLTTRGMEGVFSIRLPIGPPSADGAAPTGVWFQILNNFGSVTLQQIKASHEWSQVGDFDHVGREADLRGSPPRENANNAFFDKYDKENLRLSAIVVKASIGPNLQQRLASILEPNASGPEVFKAALDQVMCMNATTLRTLSNQLGALSLKSIPGESVSALTEKVSELAREIEGSGTPPSDLKNLVSKPYTKGTVEAFKTHALGIHMSVMRGTHAGSWQSVVTEHNAVYQDLVQSEEYPPANGGKKDQDDKIQGLVAKVVDQKLSHLKSSGGGSGGNGKARACFKCGSTEHLIKDCPKNDSKGGSNKKSGSSDSKKDEERDWRHIPPNPKKGESKEKTIEGKKYKWCGKCRKNKGLWTTGKYLHSTEEHRSKKSDDSNDNNSSNNTSSEQGNIGYVDGPLEFGFCAFINQSSNGCNCVTHPKGRCGEC